MLEREKMHCLENTTEKVQNFIRTIERHLITVLGRCIYQFASDFGTPSHFIDCDRPTLFLWSAKFHDFTREVAFIVVVRQSVLHTPQPVAKWSCRWSINEYYPCFQQSSG